MCFDIPNNDVFWRGKSESQNNHHDFMTGNGQFLPTLLWNLPQKMWMTAGWFMIFYQYKSVGWWFGTLLVFSHSVGNFIIPIDFHIFQRGWYLVYHQPVTDKWPPTAKDHFFLQRSELPRFEAMISLSARGFSTVEGAEEVEQLLGKGLALLSQTKCLILMWFNMIWHDLTSRNVDVPGFSHCMMWWY